MLKLPSIESSVLGKTLNGQSSSSKKDCKDPL
jgi:hypothetical protein